MTLAAGYSDRKAPSAGSPHAVNGVTAPAGTVAVNANKGDLHVITMTGNISSSSITNPTVGQIITLEWLQDGTGTRTYVWPANCKFAGGAAPAASTLANYSDSVTFRYDGTNWREISRAVAVR